MKGNPVWRNVRPLKLQTAARGTRPTYTLTRFRADGSQARAVPWVRRVVHRSGGARHAKGEPPAEKQNGERRRLPFSVRRAPHLGVIRSPAHPLEHCAATC